ncbi:MAG: sigma-70 family RNA polymerase sigma factor [Planctomycetes bacterium]|nr:sigma-70 family RNA polymerase sigma factor [Planctomycetota bacterium]
MLVRQVQAGEASAFTTLVTKYQDRVFNACYRICGHRDDAGDLTQEAFMKAFQSIDGFHGKSAFYTWVFRIAVNLSLSWRRKQHVRRAISLDDTEGGPGEGDQALKTTIASDQPHDPSRALAASENERRVANALSELDPDQRVAVVLRDIEGMDYQNIADTLEVAVGTVKSRIYRGRLALRELLTETTSPIRDKERFLT